MNRNRTEILRPTQDDWYPNFDNNQVEVSCITDMDDVDGNVWHRVCVWGRDDDGMEIDFFGKHSKVLAEELYKQVINLPFVNKNNLKQMGFVRA